MRMLVLALPFLLGGCVTLQMAGGKALCVRQWSADEAQSLGAAVDALPLDSPLRSSWAEYIDIRKEAKRC